MRRRALALLFVIWLVSFVVRLNHVQNTLERQIASVDGQQIETTGLVLAVDRRAKQSFVTTLLPNKTRIRVTDSPHTPVAPGESTNLNCTVEWPVSKPGEFDYGLWLKRQGFAGTCRAQLSSASPTTTVSNTPYKWLHVWRERIKRQIRLLIPEPEAGLLAGLLIGARADMSEDLTESLRRTGTSHIIAVSGANVVIVGSAVLWLCRFITYRPRLSFWVTQAAIWLFVLLTGASAAATRGGLSASILITAQHRSRSPPAGILLSITAGLMLLYNPYIWADVGWQLSIAAFAGLLYIGKQIAERQPIRSLPEVVKPAAAETTAASVTTMPISLVHFGTLSLTGLIANPLILWLVPIATAVGVGSLVVTAVWPDTISIFRTITWLPLKMILTIIAWLDPLPLNWQFGD